MNIYKKTMLLMALCCSLGVTTSAVESSQPQDREAQPQDREVKITQKTTPNVESMKELKDSAKDRAAKMLNLMNLYDPQNMIFNESNASHPVNIINSFECWRDAFTLSKDDFQTALMAISSDTALSKKEKLTKESELAPISYAANALSINLNKEIVDVLRDVPVPTGKYNKNISEYLKNADNNISIYSFLEYLRKNRAHHQENLQKHFKDVKNIANNDDSDQESQETAINAQIKTEKKLIDGRSQLITEILKIFNNKKSNIMSLLTNYLKSLGDNA